MFAAVIDFQNDADKRKLWGVLKHCSGKQRVEICRHRQRRSDRANRYYWGVVVPAARQALYETQGEMFDPEESHEFLKALFLSKPIVDKRTGELLATVVGSSAKLNTEQFSDYVEKVRLWLADYAGVILPDAETFATA